MKKIKFPKKHKFNKFAKRTVAFTAAAAMFLTYMPLEEMSPALNKLSVIIAHAANPPRRASVAYSDLQDFAAYSIEYSANPNEYCEDTIVLSLNQGSVNIIPSNYIPLGTEEAPFKGKILITQNSGFSWWFETDKPLFDYIADSAEINYAGETNNTEPIPIELRRKEGSALSPLFANHVVEGENTKATWKIKSAVQIQNTGDGENILVCNTSGLIGDIKSNANVTIDYENNAYDPDTGKRSNVEFSGDVGLICQSMYEGSQINLTLSGTNNGCLITSTEEGNAGGLVGKMYEGSKLKLNSTYTPDSNRSITAVNGYAGGLVGYNSGGKIIFPQNGETEIRGNIVGTDGAGGLYGYYSNYIENNTAQSVTINMKNYDINCTVKAASAGGFAGVLDGCADIIVDGSEEGSNPITVYGDTVTDFGGIAGTYQTNDLKNKFEVNNVTANTSASFTGTSYYGGVCGQITGDQSAYVKVSSLTHKSSAGFADATAFGGVVGNAGTAGSMLDVGSVTVETGVIAEGENVAPNGSAYKGGGIVGILTDGVLRLSGTTNMQKAPSASGRTNGQLVGIRKDSLVYAVGSGNANDGGWIFERSATQVNADDIGTWGSVLRISGVESDVLSFDATNHTVKVAAPVIAMENAVDFTKTALNMQLNNGDKGALKFDDSTNTKSVLLGTALSFSGSINLSKTGNIGLMRDDYKDNETEIGAYTNTISGGTVKLAIGERYGVPSTGVGRGDIVAHRYNGLLARTDTNAAASGITIDGTMNVNATVDGTKVGGAVAAAKKGITLTNVISQETINFNFISGSSHVVGGMAADVSGGDTNISGGTAKTEIVLKGNVSSIPVGGAVGKIDNASKTITVNGITVAADIDASGATATEFAGTGFIADISGGTMSLTGVTVNGTNIENKAVNHAGGFLGYQWLGTNVSFTNNNGVIVSGTNNKIDTTAKYATGLVQYATGHWTVPEKGIKISGMTITGVSDSLGLLVHDGYSGDDGLYLELTHKDSYDLAPTGISVPATTNYDELVRSTGADILSNRKNGIISITTDGDLIMDGTNCNTYQNKYNKSNVSNSKARYYYNLTSIVAKETKSDGEKLLLWSLNKYAATNINSIFADSFGTNAISGTFDLEHISYYPIDCTNNLAIGDATFIFYNDEIEASETGTGNSDKVTIEVTDEETGVVTTQDVSAGNRTTRGASQHYLMHSGVFRNASAALSTSGDIHFKGSIGVDNTYSGALINGTLSGSLSTNKEKEIVFEGLTLSDPTKYLFINKMTTNSKLTLSGVRTGGGKDFNNTNKSSETKYTFGATVASSLIGDVSGNGIQISFERMKLDSREAAAPSADLSAIYGTTKSIFSGATFLNKFAVDNNSTGTYNFEESLDWSNGTHNANVTYGMEIKTSVEYENKQQKYYDQAHFVDPVADPSARTDVYDFNTGFLPYVKESTAIRKSSNTSSADYAISKYDTRELKVNVITAGLSEGCGTYNHPYEITLGTQFFDVATSINKSGYLSKLRLPKINCNSDSNLTNLNNTIAEHWCDDKTECAVFTYDKDNHKYTYTENNTTYTWTEDQVSLYLASAYYIVKNNIDIVDNSATDKYKGLGASPTGNTTGKYAFRGVIIGASSDGSITITNRTGQDKTNNNDNFHNTMGLITMSNGCVVKNLTIKVDLPDSDQYNYRSNGNQAYGYNENFTNYGAVINKVMGGDNIIDNVTVRFEDNFKVQKDSDYKATVGGYVGCVVNGGLIFRNVDDTSLKDFTVKRVNDNGVVQSVSCNGNTITNLTDEKDLIHIHVNPFVGRVINGYAIRESDHYAFSEDGETYGDGETRENAVEVTMHNTRKNYSIPDIDKTKNFQDASSSVLTFSKPEGETLYNTITVPDGQALYIMSIIAQSGSGCASSDDGDYAYNISYCGSATRNYTGYNNTLNNKATHWAAYDAIGNDTQGDDYNLSVKDTINQKKAVPYIIQKYTSSYTSGTTTYYLPDCFRGIGFLGSNTLDDNMKIYGFNGNGTSANPAVIDVNTEYFLNQRADDPYWGPNNSTTSNNPYEYKVGIGLFNNLKQSSSTGFDRKYESDSKYQITNFTLQGYLSAHHVNSSGADQKANPSGNRDAQSMNTAGLVPTILFNDVTLYNFSNISFKKIHINSYAYAGGFVGYANDSSAMIYINNCNADGFKIEGSGRVAGFVGSYDTIKNKNSGIHINTGLDSSGNDSFTSVMKNTIINNRLDTDVKHNYTAGIVGAVYADKDAAYMPDTDNGDNALGHLILRNVTIEGGDAEKNYIGNKNNPNGSSGGIMGGGTAKVYGCLIQNCTVKDIDIYGRHAGGIFGENSNFKTTMNPPSVTSARIVGCTVTGELDENGSPQYSIVALQYAGGVYGATCDIGRNDATYKNITYQTDIDGVYIYGYNICSRNTGNTNQAVDSADNLKKGFAAGGITGNNDNDRYIQNCKVEKCVIDVGTNASSATNTPCGGLIGRIQSGNIYGYNIEVKDCDFQTHQWSNGAATNVQKAYTYTDDNGTHNPVDRMKCGNVIGNGNEKNANIIAIHVENCPAEKDFNSVADASFDVYADYQDIASGNKHGEAMSALSTLTDPYSNVGEGGLTDYFPHVNVSPVIDMGTDNFLTSDGAALYSKRVTSQGENNETITKYVKTPVIDAIVNDSDSNYSKTSADTKSYIQRALSSTASKVEPNKISTYKTEMGVLPDGVDDFTVLVINTENRGYTTTFINNYIQMISNTAYDYMDSTKRSNKFQIDVYPCTFNGTNYVIHDAINPSGKSAGLAINSYVVDGATKYEYFMRNTHADSNQGDYQFSLMDVQFYNPNTTIKEVVYHLYIPVLTKKMLMFDFYSASQSGTDNKNANFAHFGNTLAESLNSWYTGYVQFSYNQTELQSILESGAGLNWNGAKNLLLKYQTDTVEAKLGADTQLVLCDPNNSDKYYYATLRDMRGESDTDGENDTISFAKFNSQLDGQGTPFKAATLNDMLLAQGFTITAETAAAGTADYIYVPTNNRSEADVIISENEMYRKADENANEKGTVKLSISYPKADNSGENDDSKVLIENYYLAVRADGNSVYNYSIRTTATTSGGADKPTLRRANDEEGNVTNIIMGNLYSQTVRIEVLNNNTSQAEINSSNHRLDVNLSSTIRLTGSDSDKDYMLNHLSNPNIHLYQAFIINLTAKDETGNRSEILGTPDVTTDFTLSGTGKETYTEDNVKIDGTVKGSFIQLKNYDMKEYLSKNGTAMIKAETQIDFAEPWQYNAEFPVQDGLQEQIGVNVSAKSNLAYSEDKLRFTNMTQNPNPPSSKHFYIKDSDKADLIYNMKSEILDEYDKIGEPSFNYSQQGINPRNFIDNTLTRLPIKTTATYSAINIRRSDFVKAAKIQYTLKLYKKSDTLEGVKYVEVSDVANYIDLTTADSVFIKINSGVTNDYTAGGKMTKTNNNDNNLITYAADIDQTAFTSKEKQRITADIDFTVITGDDFQDYYANYRFVLDVDLLDDEGNPLTPDSNARDWVVYTNAKINPDMLTSAEEMAG